MDPLDESLLQLDEPAGTPPAEPAEPPAKSGTSEPVKLDKRVEDLEETNKNLQEQMRQQIENNKTLSDFRDNILKATGSNDEDEKKRNQELLIEFDKNPIETTQKIIQEQIEKSLSGVKENVDLQRDTSVIKSVMDEVDKKYDVNWSKDLPKIKDQLKNFNVEAFKTDPQGTILAACKLADVIKAKAEPPLVEPVTKRGGLPNAAGKTHSEEVSDRMKGYVGKGKSGNVFRKK